MNLSPRHPTTLLIPRHKLWPSIRVSSFFDLILSISSIDVIHGNRLKLSVSKPVSVPDEFNDIVVSDFDMTKYMGHERIFVVAPPRTDGDIY